MDYLRLNLHDYLPSRNAVKKAIKQKRVLINDNEIEWKTEVKHGDSIVLFSHDVKHKTFHLDLPVIYEDDYLAVINKPAGYPVSGNSFKTIQNALIGLLTPSPLPDAFSVPRPVHRLDAQTSGLLVIAKNTASAMDLSKQFEEKTIQKTYLCICKNTFPHQLNVNSEVDDKEAETHFVLVKSFTNKYLGELSLIEAKPKTGRTHQIRKHLSGNGFPILGDKLYGEYYNKGLFLQASGIEFQHPITGNIIPCKLELPNKFLNILNHIK